MAGTMAHIGMDPLSFQKGVQLQLVLIKPVNQAEGQASLLAQRKIKFKGEGQFAACKLNRT